MATRSRLVKGAKSLRVDSRVGEMSIAQSNQYVKKLMQTTHNLKKEDYRPGSLIFYKYDAKDKEQTYDQTPLVLVLRSGKKYMLGLNFHWLPLSFRMFVIDRIIEQSSDAIKRRNKIEFTYSDFKPLFRSVNY